MNRSLPSKDIVARLRDEYPEGTRVELVSMDDPYSKLRPGDKGRVSHVDDAGTIFVNWDSGSGLGIVYGEDSVRKIENERNYDTGADFWKDTAVSYGLEEAEGICGRYLSMQIKTESKEEQRFCKELFTAMMEDTLGRANPDKLVYPFPFAKADDRMEASLYHESRDRNAYCAQAIDTEINASCYKTNYYNLEHAAMSVIQEYGFACVNAVLAHNLQRHDFDGRYSRGNKEWAAGFKLSEGAFEYAYMKSHPILLEDFTKHTRALYETLGAERFALPGHEEHGEVVHGYEVIRSISFNDQRGFAIGHNPEAVAPFVCWQFTDENGKRDFFWGRYGGDMAGAADQYTARVMEHMSGGQVKVIENPIAAVEMSIEQNYNMIDGLRNNLAAPKADLTDGQTHDEIQELAPETLPGVAAPPPDEKPSVMEQIREARKAPATPHKHNDGHGKEEPSL